jgi:5-hydroxyisourate hydrolase
VLDTARGTGAGGMRVDFCGPDGVVKSATLDDGGRAVLLAELVVGAYEISFHAGAYQAEKFYDVIPVRFNIADPAQHYHIPLILSPFGYSTYRGG